MEVKWMNYKGKKILYVDYRGAKSEIDMIAVLNQEAEIEKKSNEKILVLANFENTHGTQKYMNEVKRLGKEIRNEKVGKTALLGITGLKKILMNAYITFTGDKNMKEFENEEKAMDWLV